MRIARFFLVMVTITVLFAATGALFGYLLGAAVPRQLTVQGGAANGTGMTAATQPATAGSVSVAASMDVSPAASGALVGAAFGLLAGVGLGLFVAVIDQIILAVRLTRTPKTTNANRPGLSL